MDLQLTVATTITLVAIPVFVVGTRLLYCLLALVYCWLALTPNTYSYVKDEPWFRTQQSLALQNSTSGRWPVPPIIHQILLQEMGQSNVELDDEPSSHSKDVPARWQAAQKSCVSLHPQYRYLFWTDHSAHEFIRLHYPWFLRLYLSYPFRVQRVDALKYFVLHHYGGIYLDLDVGCKWPLDGLRQYPLVLPVTEPVGLATDAIAAQPGHALISQTIAALKGWKHWYGTTYPTVMFSTGPMFLTLQFARFKDINHSVYALPGFLYSSGPKSLFRHYPGNSWHGYDSYVVFWLYKNMALLIHVALAMCAALMLWGTYYYATKCRRITRGKTKACTV